MAHLDLAFISSLFKPNFYGCGPCGAIVGLALLSDVNQHPSPPFIFWRERYEGGLSGCCVWREVHIRSYDLRGEFYSLHLIRSFDYKRFGTYPFSPFFRIHFSLRPYSNSQNSSSPHLLWFVWVGNFSLPTNLSENFSMNSHESDSKLDFGEEW